MKNTNARTAEIVRETRETQIRMALDLDGTGKRDISTSIPFMDHMLEIFARHSLIDLTVKATGDREVDDHHLVEDLGIVLGDCIDKALGDRRPYLVYSIKNDRDFIGTFDIRLVEEFFRSVATQVKMNLHILNEYGDENHHIVESVFKAFARAMRMAGELDTRETGIPSSKCVL